VDARGPRVFDIHRRARGRLGVGTAPGLGPRAHDAHARRAGRRAASAGRVLLPAAPVPSGRDGHPGTAVLDAVRGRVRGQHQDRSAVRIGRHRGRCGSSRQQQRLCGPFAVALAIRRRWRRRRSIDEPAARGRRQDGERPRPIRQRSGAIRPTGVRRRRCPEPVRADRLRGRRRGRSHAQPQPYTSPRRRSAAAKQLRDDGQPAARSGSTAVPGVQSNTPPSTAAAAAADAATATATVH